MKKIIHCLSGMLLVFCLVACKENTKIFTINSSVIYDAPVGIVGGDVHGNITIVEFFDYRCHACRISAPEVHALLSIDPSVRIVYRDLPILGEASRFAAQAAIASSYQHKYVVFHDALMGAPSLQTREEILAVAKRVGLDLNILQNDMHSAAVKKQLEQNARLAKQLQIVGTPAFLMAKTAWNNNEVHASEAILSRGALHLTSLKQMLLKLRLKT